MGSLSIWHWLIVLVIVLLVFGTKKLKNIGSDLGGAVKGFQGRHEGRCRERQRDRADAASDCQQGHRRQHGGRGSQDQVVMIPRRASIGAGPFA